MRPPAQFIGPPSARNSERHDLMADLPRWLRVQTRKQAASVVRPAVAHVHYYECKGGRSRLKQRQQESR